MIKNMTVSCYRRAGSASVGMLLFRDSRRIVTLALSGFVLCFTYSATAQTPDYIEADQQTVQSSCVNPCSITAPTNLAEGDMIVLWQTARNGGNGFTLPSGFTEIVRARDTGSSFRPEVRVSCKIATGSEPGSYSYTTDVEATDVNHGAVIGRITGHDGSCTVADSSQTNSGGTDVNSIDIPSVTSAAADSLLLAAAANRNASVSAVTVTAMTEIWEQVSSTEAGAGEETVASGATSTRTISWDASGRAAGAMFVVSPPSASAPTITSALDCNNTLDTDGFNCTVTVDEDSTGHAVACPINSTAPTAAQIKAGNCTGDVAAIEYETTSLTGTMQWSAHFTGLAGRAVYDVYFIATNAGGDSAIGSDLDSFRLARTGYEFITLTSIGAGTWCAQANTANYWDNAGLAIAIGDVLEIQTATSPSAFAVTNGVDCGLSYSGNGSRQTVSYCPLDATTGANFADPMLSPSFYEGCDDIVVFNNSDPQGSGEAYIGVWLSGAAITDIDLDTVFSDGDGDSMTYEVTTGTLPTGVSLSTNLLTGTPTTSNYPTGVTVTITAYDSFGGSGTQDFDLWVYDAAELVMPDLTDGDINDAISDELATMPWRETATIDPDEECDDMVDEGIFISQDPAATTEIDPDQVFSGTVSVGICPEQDRGFGITFPGSSF